jgi:hypothetical protein
MDAFPIGAIDLAAPFQLSILISKKMGDVSNPPSGRESELCIYNMNFIKK